MDGLGSIMGASLAFLLMEEGGFSPQAQPQQTKEQKYVAQLADYAEQYLRKGHNEREIIKFLESKGHKAEFVEPAIEIARSRIQ